MVRHDGFKKGDNMNQTALRDLTPAEIENVVGGEYIYANHVFLGHTEDGKDRCRATKFEKTWHWSGFLWLSSHWDYEEIGTVVITHPCVHEYQ